MVIGQEAPGSPEEERPYLYLTTNVLRATHTLSTGIWGPRVGLNATLLYYGNIDYSDLWTLPPESEKKGEGPSYLSLSTGLRVKTKSKRTEFAGCGLSYNILKHGESRVYDDQFNFSRFTARPRSKHVRFDQPWATLFIENGYVFSSRGLPWVLGVAVAWHPMAFEFWEEGESWTGKGYLTPYNLQFRLEFGLKWVRGKQSGHA